MKISFFGFVPWTLYHRNQCFCNEQKKKSNSKVNKVSENNQWPNYSELFAFKRIAHVNNIQDNEQYYKNEEIKKENIHFPSNNISIKPT